MNAESPSSSSCGIGAPLPRREDVRMVTGRGRYADDVRMQGQAYGYVLRSDVAHAHILRIDVSGALAVPGILAVLTAEDYAQDGWGDIPCLSIPPTITGQTEPAVKVRVHKKSGRVTAFVRSPDARIRVRLQAVPKKSARDTMRPSKAWRRVWHS